MRQKRLQVHGPVVDDLPVAGDHPGDRLRSGGLSIGVQAGQTVANDVQGEVLVALHRQGVAQTLQIRLRVAAVAVTDAMGTDEPLSLEVTDLGDRQRRELHLEEIHDLPDLHHRLTGDAAGPTATDRALGRLKQGGGGGSLLASCSCCAHRDAAPPWGPGW